MATKTTQAFEPIVSVKTASKGDQEPELKYVQEFLCRFGYLNPDGYEEGRLDDATEEALTNYQQCNGVPDTGEFDEDTRQQMTTHRCALPDMSSGVAFVARCSWPNPNLTYAFETGTNDTAGDSEFDAVRRAFDTWADVSPLTFTEVLMSQNPDIVVDWRPANDPDLSMVGGTLAHADFPPGCGVVTNTLPKPVHFDDSEHEWSIGAQVSAFDIETVALHEIGHIIGLQHTNVGGAVMFPSVSSNSTNRNLQPDDLGGVAALYPPNTLPAGTYTIKQKSSNRFLDAHESSGNDFSVVTRTAQNNDTQRWLLNPIGAVYTIRQKSSGRFMDAHESGNDFSAVTRTAQDNASQRWVLLPDPAEPSVYTVQQLVNGRFVDAHESGSDFSVVTRTAQNNDTQRWIVTPDGPQTYLLQQKSSGRYMDAHESSGNDFSIVTRTAQNNDTQRWIFGLVGMVYTVQQRSGDRFVDAHESSANDFSVVTRTAQYNNTQRWVFVPSADGSFTIQHLSRGRFLDAHQGSNDHSVVTRTAQNNDTQRWIVDAV